MCCLWWFQSFPDFLSVLSVVVAEGVHLWQKSLKHSQFSCSHLLRLVLWA